MSFELGDPLKIPIELTPEERFVNLLSEVAGATRSAILEGYEKRDTSIESTRLSLMVFEKLGIPARAQSVKVAAMNMLGWQFRNSGMPYAEWPEAAYALAIGWADLSEKDESTGWNGHLVTIVRDSNGLRHLIDISADQMNRPGYLNISNPIGMMIENLWTPMDPLFRILADGETIIEYTPFSPHEPRGRQWRDTGAWNEHQEWFDQAAEAVLSAVEASSQTD